tara:strand:- start:50 stop:1144 length:1095 start_codon:yes stop_codon:yes gene_type:complete
MGAAGAGGSASLYAWGKAQLNLTGPDNSSPVMVTDFPATASFGASTQSMFVITEGGELWSWGLNTNGTLGLGNTTAYSSPIQVGALTDWAIAGHSAYHTFHAVKSDGTLWGWGRNNQAMIGDGTTIARSSPVQIGALTDWATAVSNSTNGAATKTNGTLWTWGYGLYGALGDGTTVKRSSPVQVGSDTDWLKINLGSNLSGMAIKSNGTLWSWGWGNNGQSGTGVDSPKNSNVTQVGARTDWVDLLQGSHSPQIALTSAGKLYAWGYNASGALGLGNTTNYSSPVQIGALTDWASISGSSGQRSSFATKTDGTAWSWGFNHQGQLGLGNTTDYSSPVQIGSETGWLPHIKGGSSGTYGFFGFKE